jgi:hypothetical protein
MSALFSPWTNTVSRLSLALLGGGPVLGVAMIYMYLRSPAYTGTQDPVEQPVQFDHRHHTQDDGIDCRYCHSTVEHAPSAGMPSSATCMGCHAQIWGHSAELTPVREAYFTGRPVEWVRVHKLPDFVYFNHAIHVNKGVGCATCHGRIDEMPAVTQYAPLTMGWCLGCHREPDRNLRPRDQITNMVWHPPEDDGAVLGKTLRADYRLAPRTGCTTCHR